MYSYIYNLFIFVFMCICVCVCVCFRFTPHTFVYMSVHTCVKQKICKRASNYYSWMHSFVQRYAAICFSQPGKEAAMWSYLYSVCVCARARHKPRGEGLKDKVLSLLGGKCIDMCVCVCVCVCISICVCLCVCLLHHTRTHTHTHTHTPAHTHKHTHNIYLPASVVRSAPYVSNNI
jgi:hypothetical protein